MRIFKLFLALALGMMPIVAASADGSGGRSPEISSLQHLASNYTPSPHSRNRHSRRRAALRLL